MSRIEELEESVHGRRRNFDKAREIQYGVFTEMLYARKAPALQGAQWTGVLTSIALEMLASGKVDGVICVASQESNPMAPRPVLATTAEQILATRGVKPSLSPNLSVLSEVEARGIKRLLFIGVGCAVQALRSVEQYLGLEELFVLGTNCTDNGTSEGLAKFLDNASTEPETVVGYEFMQDYQVHRLAAKACAKAVVPPPPEAEAPPRLRSTRCTSSIVPLLTGWCHLRSGTRKSRTSACQQQN